AIALHSADGQRVLLADGLAWQSDGASSARLTGYQAGNGIRFAFERDGQGRLSQISASRTGAVIDRQQFTHDSRGRIVGTAHNGEHIGYAYDERGRLTGAADRDRAEGFAHDSAGNRLVHLTREGGVTERLERHRHDRDGRLLATELDQGTAPVVRRFGRTARGDLGIELALDPAASAPTHAADRSWAQARLRGVIRGPHGRAIAAFADQRVLAVYDYDVRGLRVRRSTAQSPERTDLYLHQDGLLTGVADARGRLRHWIVRLGQWPVAELSFDEGRLTRVHWLLADQRAAPVRTFDHRGDTLWQDRLSAFGMVASGGMARVPGQPVAPIVGRPDDSLLRLAGHWFDPETGRHENGWRSYIPDQGRYAQPDPLGPLVGGNERTYAGADPINRIDPFGLYEVDVHYYLTYFLARAAGVSAQRAYTVALAAQYVDDNPQTRPETPENTRARSLYHFVMASHDPSGDASTRYFNPRSPQLTNLYQASLRSVASECARVLLLGEFLHTFEDTFSHRDSNNVPFGATMGHLFAGHDPDQTYDVSNSAAPEGSPLRRFVDYPWNEERSMRMAQETYGVLQRYFGSRPVASFAQIETVVRRFMQTGAAQYAALLSRAIQPETAAQYTARKERELRDKIAVLDEALIRLGLGSFNAQYSDARGNLYQATYRREAGEANRRDYLAGLRHGATPATDPFNGVLLPGD
ncbi:MAG: RHS repeat-associated core domain-containing protein, partial [Burkholderiaceae bacterium]|nr:RHS repeat-associated core domain-containing protein [Burkholderiaceae bacterium]